MPVEQAGTNPPETQSYDAEMMADVRSAFTETATKAAETVTETPADAAAAVKTEPEAKVEAPADKTIEPRADHPTDPARYADGTFKPKAGEPEKGDTLSPKTAEKADAGVSPPSQVPVPQAIQGVTPPGGWSPKSKSEWDKLPEHIRADIAKREKEVADGFAQYEGMRELRPYVEMARGQGQTLKQALDRYVGIENALRTPQALQAILHIAGNAGYSPQRLVQELAPQLGLNQQQGNHQDQGAQPPFDPNMLQQHLNPLMQEVSQLKSLYQQQSEAQRAREMSTIGTVLDRFKSDPAHRYYENVEPQMTQLFERGVVSRTGDYAADLKAAYDMACRSTRKSANCSSTSASRRPRPHARLRKRQRRRRVSRLAPSPDRPAPPRLAMAAKAAIQSRMMSAGPSVPMRPNSKAHRNAR
jgi:hypothetical protein